jgi:hypothetical protein
MLDHMLRSGRQSISKLPIWVLLFAWLFCGGVVLAEQFELPVESSEQESQACEHALQILGHALQSQTEAPHGATSSYLVPVVHDFLPTYAGLVRGRSFLLHPVRSHPLNLLVVDLIPLLQTYRI